MLFAPYLVCQAGGSALPDHIQPVLKFYLFIRSQSGNVHGYSPLSGFRVLGVDSKNSNLRFTGERHIFHYTFLFGTGRAPLNWIGADSVPEKGAWNEIIKI